MNCALLACVTDIPHVGGLATCAQVHMQLQDKASFYAFQSSIFFGMEPRHALAWWNTCGSSEALPKFIARLRNVNSSLTAIPRSMQVRSAHACPHGALPLENLDNLYGVAPAYLTD